ncbi:MAG: DUF72 domain-containing protein [Candidatus Aerophobetes bacterium]|nr:DUF72 domain-containing protein [Candidatus Aerophobetes bacterium]
MPQVIIGTSGWWYEHWEERFYPKGMEKKEWFSYYAKSFDTVEINSSFYRLPFENVVKGWAKKAPKNFKFTLKMWRRITHYKRLKDVENDLEIFFARISPLYKNIGAILYQLPPSLKKDNSLLENFLKLLPEELDQAIEFRNKSWLTPETLSLLEKENIAYCIISMPKFPESIHLTSNISYIRFHGKETLYGSSYSEEELKKWAEKIRVFFNQGVERAYVYFNNDYNAYAVFNALKLKELIRTS